MQATILQLQHQLKNSQEKMKQTVEKLEREEKRREELEKVEEEEKVKVSVRNREVLLVAPHSFCDTAFCCHARQLVLR